MNEQTHCQRCGRAFVRGTITTGYGIYGDGAQQRSICFPCCGELDLEEMRASGRAVLYLTLEKTERTPTPASRPERVWTAKKLTNWPGSLYFPLHVLSMGHHNIAGTRFDIWFRLDGHLWHGVQYGRDTQLCHCRRTKARTEAVNNYELRGGAGYEAGPLYSESEGRI